MRCVACDRGLNDFEATRKYKTTGEFADLCNKCVKELDGAVQFSVRHDLEPFACTEDAYDDEGNIKESDNG